MFYNVASLRRGGRFYWCWVADSWPHQFASITSRQLWSRDVRDFCDDLMVLVNSEAGVASSRFSLRLSSQLLRGLARLYQRKVQTCLDEICSLDAKVYRIIHKKYEPQHKKPAARTKKTQVEGLIHPEELEVEKTEERIECIPNNSNVVANIETITLKEASIPVAPIPNDGFGEENPDQVLQLLLQDHTVEFMRDADISAVQTSGLLPVIETGERSHDIMPEPSRAHLELIEHHDVTLLRKSTADELQRPEEHAEIEIPQFPEIPTVPQIPERVTRHSGLQVVPDPEVQLEELDEPEPAAKRVRRPKLLIRDKCLQINLRPRLNTCDIELRCKSAAEDVIDLHWQPVSTLFTRPLHAGRGPRTNLALPLQAMFLRKLTDSAAPRRDSDIQQVLANGSHRPQRKSQPPNQTIEPAPPLPNINIFEASIVPEVNITAPDMVIPAPDITAALPDENLSVANRISSGSDELAGTVITTVADIHPEPKDNTERENMRQQSDSHVVRVQGTDREPLQDISNLLTQVLEPSAPAGRSPRRKRRAPPARGDPDQAKRPRSVGGERRSAATPAIQHPSECEQAVPTSDLQQLDPTEHPVSHDQSVPDPRHAETRQARISSILEELRLSDARPGDSQRRREKGSSDEAESMLGSLDRTKVDLGEQETPTDSQMILKHEWGCEGTMMKITRLVRRGAKGTSFESLLKQGPADVNRRMAAALCFSSLLKLKQYQFIRMDKKPGSTEISNIMQTL